MEDETKEKLVGYASIILGVIGIIIVAISLFVLYFLKEIEFEPESEIDIIWSIISYLITLILIYFGYIGYKKFKYEGKFPLYNAKLLIFLGILNAFDTFVSDIHQGYSNFGYTEAGFSIATFFMMILTISLMTNGLFLIIKKENEFKKRSVISIIFFNCITLWIYSFVWFYKQKEVVSNLKTVYQPNNSLINIYLIFVLLYIMIYIPSQFALRLSTSLSSFNIIIATSSFIIAFSFFVLAIVISFQFKKALEEYFTEKLKECVKFSKLATFFFVFYYLQYKINRLIKE
ncbi:MAG: hypothetical protein WBB08_10850 [Halobacteriota archaeon]